ncbi:CPBP family intramembrane metalloprotease [Rhodococcus triatomae]|uniref:CAAX prenyl protease 2/Lysostaphin resistance protein A-like domain-containing protein n=1 Tax=Rhodococcus triatomae TaxID=300028 RepID=A0A1G8B3R3_9NOCA|nr:CPBP family intramembrane glutamic endopeptidase [Rhodococcus triatomae]QNG17590.1 CPBP family intramembrane metalloprotease [Rhodococcus triatomae]QNG22742.1 CPBP family intramembrane metalloprotease [Rhodococcus triatomae]SDH27869.1 hypothetical protein SAMN05444695_101639 [Rhodococcus triatomae]
MRQRLPALALAAVAVAWNNAVLPRLGLSPRGRAVANAAAGVGAVAAVRAAGFGAEETGMSRHQAMRGLTRGLAVGAIPLAGYGLMYSVPALRHRLVRHEERPDTVEWMFLHIPVGTVVAEELLFRGALSASTSRGWSPAARTALHATAFGLWHVQPARAAGDHVLGTVAVTGASVLLFDALRRHTGSVLAPALLHLTINVGGAGAAVAAARTHVVARSAPR